jgi:NADPH:quinone reductase-like Zn-dependent oxidoreductase
MFVDNWPVVLGSDCAGKVVEVGKSVTTFAVGDRVAANPASVFAFAGNKAGAFQNFTVLPAVRAFKIPNEWTYKDASVMPLATATAAIGMFAEDRLNLEYPKVQKAPSNCKIFLVWGGSSSVGACAVQMAAHAGYEVYATSSKKNFDMVKSLGASKVFDYTDVDVIANIVDAIRGRESQYAGAYSATQEGQGLPPAVQVAAQLGLSDSFVATSNPRVPQEGLPAGIRVAGSKFHIRMYTRWACLCWADVFL